MLVPSSDNNISIVVNYKLNLLHVTSLNTMTFAEIKSLTIILELCKAIFALYMHVYRVMLFTKKKENPKNLNISGIGSLELLLQI